MTMPTTRIKDGVKQDQEILLSIVREMSESMTGAQSTRHWADDAL